jgi:hypothetical protein
MPPKETKKDRERHLKKAEELTDAPTNCPTDNDDELDNELAYDAEGRLLKPGTSTAATAAVAAATAAVAAAAALTNVVVSTQLSDSSSDKGITTQGEGSVRASMGRIKRTVSTLSSRLLSKPRKLKKLKKARRRESSSLSSDKDRRRGRGPSPSSTSGSSSDPSGDSDWEELYDNATVVAVMDLLKTAPPRALHNVSKGRFSFEASGEVLFVRKADKGKKDKWMRESRSRRSDRYADYKGSISRLGHSGDDRVLQRNFGACVQPLMAIEKVLTTVPMGGSARKDLVRARRVLADRLYLLEVERETNPTVAAFVEAKRLKGDEMDLAAAVDKYTKMKKSEKASSSVGGGSASARGGPWNRAGCNMGRTPALAFPVHLPTPAMPSTSGYQQRQAPRPGACFDCLETGHRRGDAICKKKN